MNLILIALHIFAFSESILAGSVGEAEEHFKAGRFDEAASNFQGAEIDEPHNHRHAYNKGVSQYRAGQYQEAAEAFAKSAQAEDKVLRQDSLFNLGAAKAKAGDFKGALPPLEQLLKENPNHKQAEENLAWIKKLLEQQKQQDQNKKQQDQNDQQQDENKQQDQNDQQQQEQGQNQNDQQQDENKQQDQNDQQQDQNDQQQAKTENTQASQGEGAPAAPEDDGSELTEEEAMRLLKSLEDRTGQMGVPPQVKPPSSGSQGKDW